MAHTKVLMVAEKPSIALSIATALSHGRMSTRRGSTEVHEFDGTFLGSHAHFKVTSVIGHVFSVDFPAKYQDWAATDPADLFQAPVVKAESNPKAHIPRHLSQEARGCSHLVLWLDCDREGENICFEVMECTDFYVHDTRRKVHRARFSSVTEKDILKAMDNLVIPSRDEALAVDARQEIDLKVGVAFTRFQTSYFQGKYGNLDARVISYGPCQTPTLGFCVQRYLQITTFKPEKFWIVRPYILQGGYDLQLDWERGKLFDSEVAAMFQKLVVDDGFVKVIDKSEKQESKSRPSGLNTVNLLKVASSALGLGPQTAMQIAERLYIQGFISYPRTESTAYPSSFDFKGTLGPLVKDSTWGSYVQQLLNSGHLKPRQGTDAGDHPPITPMGLATENMLGSDAWKLYQYICQHFIGTISADCKYTRTMVEFSAGGESFHCVGLRVINKGFTAIMPWLAVNEKSLPQFSKGDKIKLSKVELYEGYTTAPDYLSESELISLMEKHGIGTDASISVHINNICERNYVQVQGGRKLVPTALGIMLGVDRLDMIKGIPQKLLAFEEFLEKNPRWHDKVILVQIAVPTRTDVPEYQKLTSEVHEIVGRINGRFGTLTAVPIHHLDRSLDLYALCAFYAVTDVVLVTSLRDGMNLVSYEFVICQDEKKGVLILSEFAGAAQSLGAGAILVNPWNITEVASSICYALEMPAEEREKRHNHNFNHVTSHTSQEWAETFISELNDTIVEAQLQTKQVPPSLPVELALDRYNIAGNRLIILGFNATLTEPVANPGRRGDQIREMEPKLHPDLKEPLKKLCADPTTTVLILSGSTRSVLDDNFGEFDMYLAAENGMFLRSTNGEWMTTMPENLNMDWVDSVKHVFEYFTERTPRSHFELRETSIVWNYKYADVEFGRIQAIDMLQHLWTGPISNASLDVVQGSRSVEVRAVGVTKGAAIDRILGEIVHQKMMREPIDFVLCVGHFIGKDEDIYTFFEPELPSDPALVDPVQPNIIGSSPLSNGSVCRTSRTKTHRPLSSFEKRAGNHHHTPLTTWQPTAYERLLLHKGSSVLDLKGENYFSCAVGRKLSQARYLLGSTDEVVALLKQLAVPGEPGQAS